MRSCAAGRRIERFVSRTVPATRWKRDTLIDPLQLTQLDFYLSGTDKGAPPGSRWASNYRSYFENILERPRSKRVGSLPGGLPK
jgi:hypothetical protein